MERNRLDCAPFLLFISLLTKNRQVLSGGFFLKKIWLTFSHFSANNIERQNCIRILLGDDYEKDTNIIGTNHFYDILCVFSQRFGGDIYRNEHERQRCRQFAAGGFRRERGGDRRHDCF